MSEKVAAIAVGLLALWVIVAIWRKESRETRREESRKRCLKDNP